MRNKTETKITLQIPDYIRGGDKQDLANDIINFIYERTVSGKNVFGRPWSGKAGKYTNQYKKVSGKSEPVDMELSGKMLSKMIYFPSRSKKGEVTIGFRSGTKDEKKAEGNIQGTYGQPSPIPGKARPFLDILKKDLNNIVADFINDRQNE
jgi:hypothetical protein